MSGPPRVRLVQEPHTIIKEFRRAVDGWGESKLLTKPVPIRAKQFQTTSRNSTPFSEVLKKLWVPTEDHRCVEPILSTEAPPGNISLETSEKKIQTAQCAELLLNTLTISGPSVQEVVKTISAIYNLSAKPVIIGKPDMKKGCSTAKMGGGNHA